MRTMVVTTLYPALIEQHGHFSQHKLVLTAPVPASIQPLYIVSEVRNPAETAASWLGMNHYVVKRSTLVAPFFAPDGKLILQRWNCFSTIRPMGKVAWNKKDSLMNMNLMLPKVFIPASAPYFCFEERFHIPTLNLDLHCKMAPNLQRTPGYSANIVEDELPHNYSEMLQLQTTKVDDDIPTNTSQLSVATSEHYLANLLPSDPFGMGSSDSSD